MGKTGKGKKSKVAPYAKPTVQVTYDGDVKSKGKEVMTKAKATKSQPVSKPKSASKAKAGPAVDVPAKTPADVPAPSRTFKIIAGSYEKILYGLEGHYPATSAVPTLEPVFIFPAHLAYVKAVAASEGGKWLATGSEDEFIKVWDLRRRKEVGSLSQHTGSITSLTFPSPSHLVATSADATISLFRTSDWALLKSLKGHSGRVNHVDVHPTGKVALSVGKDNTLKMWDLMRGRGAASLPLGAEAEIVKFSPKGTHFAVLFPKKVEIYSLTLKLLHTLETKSRFNHVLFAEVNEDMEVLCVGTEKGVVEVYSVEMDDEDVNDDEEDDDDDEDLEKNGGCEITRVGTLTGHSNRIKAVAATPFESSSGPTTLLTTVSTDGLINVYDLAQLGPTDEIAPVASYDTDASRLTCVTIVDAGIPKVMGAKRDPVEAEVARRIARFAVEAEESESESEGEGEDMYDSGVEQEEDGMEVEFEDEDEEEEEEEEEEEMEED